MALDGATMGFSGQLFGNRKLFKNNRRPISLTMTGRINGNRAQGWRIFEGDVVLPLVLTGLILMVPAATLPIVTVSRFGSEHTGLLFSGVGALWRLGMPALGVWVLICGSLAPMALLVILASLRLREGQGRTATLRPLSKIALVVAEWTMPEVQVLAILVAVAKIGSLVEISLGAGFWCYFGMSIALLGAWSSAYSRRSASEVQAVAEEPQPPSAQSAAGAAALGLTVIIMLVPANLLPVIRTTIGHARDDTIYTGIVSLFDRGLWGDWPDCFCRQHFGADTQAGRPDRPVVGGEERPGPAFAAFAAIVRHHEFYRALVHARCIPHRLFGGGDPVRRLRFGAAATGHYCFCGSGGADDAGHPCI
jgi:hypothetical protein